jgi:formamidopyrimidine-DNA glycosylase
VPSCVLRVLTRPVARIVHYLRKSLVGKTLAVVKAQDDSSVFGKVGTSAAELETALTGKKVVDAGQQGKYFW